MEKNVVISDENGKTIGSTYLRRAKGLVKKNRAAWVDDSQNAVILSCPPDIVEEDNIMEINENAVKKNLFFNPREWSFDKKCEKKIGERCFIEDSYGELVEAYCIGDWNWNWTQIVSKPYALEKNCDYAFTFWLNGGENDRNDEICQLKIFFDEDAENCNIYKLNRNYIKPKKHIDGWYLFEIPFSTRDNDVTRFMFISMRAPMAIKAAKRVEDYADLESTPIDPDKPQRHNIVFQNGWEAPKKTNCQNNDFSGFNFGEDMDFGEMIKARILSEIDVEQIADDIRDNLGEGFSDEFKEQMKQQIISEIQNSMSSDS